MSASVFFKSKRPFIEVLRPVIVASNLSETTGEFHSVIEFDQLRPSDIICTLYGQSKEKKAGHELFGLGTPYFSISSVIPESGVSVESVSSSTAYVKQSRSTSLDEHHVDWEMDLGCLDISIATKVGSDNEPRHGGKGLKRRVTFFLAGPDDVWGTHWSSKESFTGDVSISPKDQVKAYGSDDIASLKIVPWFYFDKDQEVDTTIYQRSYVMALVFEAETSADGSPLKDFIERCSSRTTDLLLLGSLVSRARIDWFCRSVTDGNLWQRYRRVVSMPEIREISYDGCLVNNHKIDEFLQNGMPQMESLRKQGIDISLAIDHFLLGQDRSKSLTERFLASFLALESIRSQLSVQISGTGVLDVESFKSLKDLLKDKIKQSVERDQASLIIDKLEELNRPSMRRQLKSIFQEHNVTSSDLYRKGIDNFSFIKTRNNLVHKGAIESENDLFMELQRVNAIVERLLLRLLGWGDFSRAPGQHILEYLSSAS